MKRAARVGRRDFLKAAGATAAAACVASPRVARGAEAFTLPPLPWAENALEPVVSARTIGFHYGKHHRGYVQKLNELAAGTEYAEMPLEKVVVATAKLPEKAKVFNNAAQVWNHTFYWQSLRAGGGGPPAALAEKIDAAFGGLEALKKKLADAAIDRFGSGWAWLVLDSGALKVLSTSNAETPISQGMTPLVTVDVWEHAYYLDYQNRRADHVRAVIDKLLNWELVAERMAKG